jgi:hypothetical protein|tara:strand:+ start:152 stop:325 length:174 start_codon:yes stop_codon:yes gene_type:complete
MKIDWEYINKYRRKSGNRHQIYIEGKWSDIEIPGGYTFNYEKIEPDYDWENEVKNKR